MPAQFVLMVRSKRREPWVRHGVYPTQDEAWVAITGLANKTAHVRIVETTDDRPDQFAAPRPNVPDVVVSGGTLAD